MLTLGIETSCDETAVGLVKSRSLLRHEVLLNLVASHTEIFEKYGGVVPNLAAREHTKNLPVLLKKAFLFLGRDVLSKIDAIAVTSGPGLEIALLTGLAAAKALAFAWQKPCFEVDHLRGHIFSAFIDEKGQIRLDRLEFPAVGLLVSGGHTQIWRINNLRDMIVVGQTRDDAAGEAFDKVGRLLGLGYPGGPEIERQALKGNPEAFNFPRPMIQQDNFDFSFSGLKTAVLYKIRDEGLNIEDGKVVQDLAASFQKAVVEVLTHKTLKAARSFRAKTVIVSGGVSANKTLKETLMRAAARVGCRFFSPLLAYATDNAVMIALAGNIENLL